MSRDRVMGEGRAVDTYRARKAENIDLDLLRQLVLAGARGRSAGAPRFTAAWVVAGTHDLHLLR